MHNEWNALDHMREYLRGDLDYTQNLYDLSRLGGTAANSGPDYERIDNPISVYLFEDKAVIICEDGRVVEYAGV
jgi:hypothetical protein